jgi:hypothetical protein
MDSCAFVRFQLVSAVALVACHQRLQWPGSRRYCQLTHLGRTFHDCCCGHRCHRHNSCCRGKGPRRLGGHFGRARRRCCHRGCHRSPCTAYTTPPRPYTAALATALQPCRTYTRCYGRTRTGRPSHVTHAGVAVATVTVAVHAHRAAHKGVGRRVYARTHAVALLVGWQRRSGDGVKCALAAKGWHEGLGFTCQ